MSALLDVRRSLKLPSTARSGNVRWHALQVRRPPGRYRLGLWFAVMVASSLAAALGYGLLGGVSGNGIAAIQAFAAGAILTMLADTMMPEAFEHGGSVVGLVTVLGFAGAFPLSAVG